MIMTTNLVDKMPLLAQATYAVTSLESMFNSLQEFKEVEVIMMRSPNLDCHAHRPRNFFSL